MREENQLRIIRNIIEEYKLDEPLFRFLKKYFKQHRNMGSHDRSIASSFVFNYFRLGKALNDGSEIERLIIGNFLCTSETNPLLNYCLKNLPSIREEELSLPLQEKFKIVKQIAPSFNHREIFPFVSLMSDRIDETQFKEAFLHRPLVWIRVRKKLLKIVQDELEVRKIYFSIDDENPLALSFPNSTALTNLKSFEKGYFEIQDWASQQTLKYIPVKENDFWWDACAGSGGKSLMLADAEPSLKIFATDTRDSILENLKERFRKTGFRNYKSFAIDLAKDISPNDIPLSIENLTGIIADVPCSGSGTWARTPEWLSMFNETELEKYQLLQRKIIENLVQFLKPGMPLVYITCSVFRRENEENLDYFAATLPLKIIQSAYINGIQHNADTLFAAQLVRI